MIILQDNFDGDKKENVNPKNEVEQIIEDKYLEIESKERNSESDYDSSRPREWLTSGPFQIDREKYYLGEKIFINGNNLAQGVKGEMLFIKPQNVTHFKILYTILFDGSVKSDFKIYIEPKLSLTRDICSVDDIVGNWMVYFNGTSYPPIAFNFINQTIPGDEEKFIEKVC